MRKAGEKSKNRMSVTEVGALAVAANVKHLSLTSNYDNASIEQPRHEGNFSSSNMTKMSSPANIQNKWNTAIVLMILIAYSGLVVWNPVKRTAQVQSPKQSEQEVGALVVAIPLNRRYDEANNIKKLFLMCPPKYCPFFQEKLSSMLLDDNFMQVFNNDILGSMDMELTINTRLKKILKDLSDLANDYISDCETLLLLLIYSLGVIKELLDNCSKYAVHKTERNNRTNILRIFRSILDKSEEFVKEFLDKNEDIKKKLPNFLSDHAKIKEDIDPWDDLNYARIPVKYGNFILTHQLLIL